MKKTLIVCSLVVGIVHVGALTISEIMSNPVGDDAGREWIEVYNNEQNPVDISSLTVSVKGASPVGIVILQGDKNIPPNGYAIVSSIISASQPVSKFLDTSTGYPTYTGPLMRTASTISLVNTGTTSVDIRLQGSVVDSISSYTPASEGKTLSRILGVFTTGIPTPGTENQAVPDTQIQTTSTQTNSQATVIPMSAPSPDIILYLPREQVVVAGADTSFSVYGMTRSGKTIENLKAVWAFGDGGQGIGTSTTYTYAYPGRYIASVEAGDIYVKGMGITKVTVVLPEITITSFNIGKYGAYIDITNPNEYDLDVSQWKLHVGNALFPFPKNTILQKNATTRISGRAMGFASTTPESIPVVRITFPNLEEVTRLSKGDEQVAEVKTATTTAVPLIQKETTFKPSSPNSSIQKNTSKKEGIYAFSKPQQLATSSISIVSKKPAPITKDTKIVSFFRSIFSH